MGMTLTVAAESPFASRTPKSDAIHTVKLTADNLQAVGSYVLGLIGGSVAVTDDYINIGLQTFYVGQWLVEEWDYSDDRYRYQVASLAERQKYNLR